MGLGFSYETKPIVNFPGASPLPKRTDVDVVSGCGLNCLATWRGSKKKNGLLKSKQTMAVF